MGNPVYEYFLFAHFQAVHCTMHIFPQYKVYKEKVAI